MKATIEFKVGLAQGTATLVHFSDGNYGMTTTEHVITGTKWDQYIDAVRQLGVLKMSIHYANENVGILKNDRNVFIKFLSYSPEGWFVKNKDTLAFIEINDDGQNQS